MAIQIDQQLYLGDYTVLQQFHLPDSVNLCLMCEDEFVYIFNCLPKQFRTENFKFIEFYDDDEIDKSQFMEVIEEAINYIVQNIQQGKNVIVNCAGGVSRSPSIIISYLMRKNKWTYQEAFLYLSSQYKRYIRPNDMFIKYLNQ